MAKKEFKWWKRECVNAEVIENTPTKLVVYFYWYIGIKKNWKRAFRWIVLPSENYCEWHKRMMKALWWIEYKFNSFPCSLHMCSLSWDKRKSDIDNSVQWIMDIFTELWVFPDDNKFVVSELKVNNLWYIKNCYITKVELSKCSQTLYDISEDCEWKNLKELKSFINNQI